MTTIGLEDWLLAVNEACADRADVSLSEMLMWLEHNGYVCRATQYTIQRRSKAFIFHGTDSILDADLHCDIQIDVSSVMLTTETMHQDIMAIRQQHSV